MRLFIAIDIPDSMKDYASTIQKNLGDGLAKVAWVRKGHMHLTLKFLGEVPVKNVKIIVENIKKIKFKTFSLYLNSIGFFPSRNYIRVIWIGLNPKKSVVELQKNIDENLKNFFNKESDYIPHITLGRVKFIADKSKFMDKLNRVNIDNKKMEVKNFKLMESKFVGKELVHDELERFAAK